MARFAKAENQAKNMARELREEGKIGSLRSMEHTAVSLKQFVEYLKSEKAGYLNDFKDSLSLGQKIIVTEYLQMKAESGITQSMLDQHRQALQKLTGEKLGRNHVPDEHRKGELAVTQRYYSPEQIQAIQEHQTEKNALSTQIAQAAGLRAHELTTLRPVNDQPADVRDTDRQRWCHDRFRGREGVIYTVVGKGGLTREVSIPSEIANRLESQRLPGPKTIKDRGIFYQKHYDIGSGKAWSQSFYRGSKAALGFSLGSHALRHTYANTRMGELQNTGKSRADSLGIVSQEMGHFREDITENYIR